MTLLPGLWLVTSSFIFRFIGEGCSSAESLFCSDRSLFSPTLDAPLTDALARLLLLQCLDRFQQHFFLACSFLLCFLVKTVPDLFALLHALGDDLTCGPVSPALTEPSSSSSSSQSHSSSSSQSQSSQSQSSQSQSSHSSSSSQSQSQSSSQPQSQLQSQPRQSAEEKQNARSVRLVCGFLEMLAYAVGSKRATDA